jgi:hypothetical protein
VAIDTTTTALAPFKEVRDILEAFPRERYHLLLSTTYIGSSPLFIPAPTVVFVDPEDERDVYKTPGGRDDDISFHATALQRIANAGGLDFDPSLTRHRHDRSKEPLVCEQIAAGWYIDSLGQRRLISSGWTTHDLREGSPRANLLGRQSPKAVEVARQFLCEQCATRAVSRAIRKAMNLKGSYKKSELYYLEAVAGGQTQRRPKGFVALRFRLDETDPDVKRALIARGVGASAEIFGTQPGDIEAAPARANPDALEDIQGEIVDTEPDIPDEPAPKKQRDIGAVFESFKSAAKARKDQEPATDEQLASLAYALRDVWQLADKDAMAVARRTVARSVFGVARLRDVTTAQVLVVIASTKELAGQAQLSEIRDFLAMADADFAKAVGPTK